MVCNGCTDDTAEIARAFPGVRVIEIAEPSKARAVQVGNEAATRLPARPPRRRRDDLGGRRARPGRAARADGVHGRRAPRVLPLERSVLAGAQLLPRAGSGCPRCGDGLFGRGAFALSAEGQRRVDALPAVMSDDLAMSRGLRGRPSAAIVDEATVVVHPPRTTADLLSRRVRVVTGNAQATDLGVRHPASVTTPAVLLRMAVRDPRLGRPASPCFSGSGSLPARSRAAPCGPATSPPGCATRARGRSRSRTDSRRRRHAMSKKSTRRHAPPARPAPRRGGDRPAPRASPA